MELGPIFRALVHQRTRFLLIAIEVALTLAITVNCLHQIVDIRELLTRPSGMDEEHLIALTTTYYGGPESSDQDSIAAQIPEDLRMLRQLPGVLSATSLQQFPLSGSGSATGRRVAGTEADVQTAPYFLVSDQAMETLGVELIAGRNFEASEYLDEETESAILTEALALSFFPDGDALGKRIENRAGTGQQIVGIIREMTNSWPDSPVSDHVMLLPEAKPALPWGSRYLVRVEPGSVGTLMGALEQEMLDLRGQRSIDVQVLADIRRDLMATGRATLFLFAWLIGLLFFITVLGILGVTSFSVIDRRKQIGTRRALGATRAAVVRYFLVENTLVTSAGLLLGVILSFGLNALLMQASDAPRLGWGLVVAGMLALWMLGLLAAWAPASRAARVPPVVATRSV